ncbi:MAG: ATP-binding protein, partial [Planctomycetota bacterium]
IERLKTIPLCKEQQPGELYTVDGGNDSSNTPAHGHREIAEEACDTGNNEKQEHLKALEVFPEYLRIICEETYRCKAIISNLLNFSRQSEPRFERVEIIRILHDTLAMVRHQPQLSERTIRLSISDELCYVIGDAQQLKQVFLNLIINALHAIENGGEVFVSVLQKQSSVQVVFQDSGMGIKPEHLDKIFDPFFTTKPVGEGTGLGLAICYGIIDVHNGKIDVFSEGAGKGTTITVTLPMAG